MLTIDSPFLRGGDVKIFDLREAVGICSLRYPECKVRRPWIVPAIYFIWFGLYRKRWIKFLIRIKDRLLVYYGDYISRPEYLLKPFDQPVSHRGPQVAPPTRLGPVPEGFQILSDVISFLHCSEQDAWNMPVGKAYWYQMAYFRQQGERVDFMDEPEREFQREMREHGTTKGAA